MTIPYSDTKLVNDAKPTECSIATDIVHFIQENREALNLVWDRLATTCVAIQLAAGDNVVNVAGASKVLLSTPAGVDARVVGITGGQPGSKVVFHMSENLGLNSITFVHNDLDMFMDGSMDAVFGAEDYVLMTFCDATSTEEFCTRVIDGAWSEAGRTLARRAPDMGRFWFGVNDQGALTVEDISDG